MKDFATYTLARLGLFVASYAIIAGGYMLVTRASSVPILWPLLLAAAVSAVASYYLLRGPRERFARRVDERASAAARRFEAARAKEDED